MNHYFTLLGVSPNATLQQIKKAYRKKVMKYHPDRNKQPGARAKFIAIDEAYDYLCDLRLGRIIVNTYVSSPTTKKEDKQKKSRRDWQKAKLVKEYMYQSQLLEKEANVYYVLICLPSMFILPFIGIMVGMWVDSELLSTILFFGLPSVTIYWFCSKVYDSFVPKRRKLSVKLRKDIKAL